MEPDWSSLRNKLFFGAFGQKVWSCTTTSQTDGGGGASVTGHWRPTRRAHPQTASAGIKIAAGVILHLVLRFLPSLIFSLCALGEMQDGVECHKSDGGVFPHRFTEGKNITNLCHDMFSYTQSLFKAKIRLVCVHYWLLHAYSCF